jgi:soluble lytic murein transglycosylase
MKTRILFTLFLLAVTAVPVSAVLVPSVWRTLSTIEPVIMGSVLSDDDVTRYQAIFNAQKKADWAQADLHIKALQNPVLMGHVLADRYLNRRYTANANELSQWLERYRDLPQAADIYTVAVAKTPALKASIAPIIRQTTLRGYGDDNGLARAGSDDTAHNKLWQAGLSAWKEGRKDIAAKHFISMQQHDMSPWVRSASLYWAYRSSKAIGNNAAANRYLHQAAEIPRTFYGILARKHLKQDLGLDTKSLLLSDSDIMEMLSDNGVRRVMALTQAGLTELAEKELRTQFPQADEPQKQRLLALAHTLSLASVQISMAKQLYTQERQLDFARYPIPHWQPEGGFTIDPLLLYSLMRQESGFRTSAMSSSGALGLMQIMPQTASYMQKKTDFSGNASDPINNITLGQSYVEYLLGNRLVEGNLIYMLTAYNAGAGRLQDWKEHMGDKDPLLFIEMIPFGETRHYVMQVMTNYWMYSELEGEPTPSVTALLNNKWPTYGANGYEQPVAQSNDSAKPAPRT